MGKIQRYKHELDVSYALGATLTFELVKCHPDWVTRVFLSPSIEETEGLLRLKELCDLHHIRCETNDKAFNILSPKQLGTVLFEKLTGAMAAFARRED